MLLGVLLVPLLLTGCGNKVETLSCIKEDQTGNLEMRLEHKNDQVLKEILETKLEQMNAEEAAVAKERMDTLVGAQYENQSQTTYESRVEGNTVIITLTVDVEKLTDEEKESLKIYDSLKEQKESLTSDGFVCQ